MPVFRSALSALLLALLVPCAFPVPAAADSRDRFVLLQHRPDGRDSVRVVGSGSEAHFVTDGRGPVAAYVVDPDAVERWIVTLAEPAATGSFAARVQARRALVSAFESDLPRRLPPRTGLAGRNTPRFTATFDRLLAGGVVQATAADAVRLRMLPGVRSVTRDVAVTTQLTHSVPQVRGDIVRRDLGGTGRGIRVGLLDTGIDYTHPAFGGGFGPGARVAGGWDFVNHDADPMDDQGHGTHVAGIVGGNGGGVVGMAPEVTFMAYKVLDQHGGGQISDVILALERCADPDQDPNTADAVDVVSMSLGTTALEPEDPATEAVDALDALGTTVVVAAGNSGRPFLVASPGTARGAITVGSVNGEDALSGFSSRGPTLDFRIKPDLLAPGEAITSAALGGGSVAKSGTSMATPHVAGAVALVRQLHPDWTQAEIRSAIVSGALDLGRLSSEQGSGRLDAWTAATSRLFVSPTSVAFGRIPPDGRAWAGAETLTVHSRESVSVTADLELVADHLPPGVTCTVEPAQLVLAPGAEGSAILHLSATAGRAPWADPLFVAEGVVRVRTATETHHVPFSAHEFLRLDLTAYGSGPTSVLFGGGRAWPSVTPFGSTFMLRPGTYDALCFNDYGQASEPFFGATGIEVTRDTVVAMDGFPNDRTITFDLRDERGQSIVAPAITLELLHSSGGGVGIIEGRANEQVRLPRMSSEYRLEWATGARDSVLRYDIPGTVDGPFVSRTVANDPAELRRLVEHVAVATADSVLTVEFPLFPSGPEDYWGIGFFDPFSTPHGESYDMVRWTAPTPSRPHTRFGHTLWTAHPARSRVFDPSPFSGVGAVWEQERGDTLTILRHFELGPPQHQYTGRDLPFGSGAASFRARLICAHPIFSGYSMDFFTSRWFRDAAGSSAASPPAEVELRQGGQVVWSGPAEGEERVLNDVTTWGQVIPGGGRLDATVVSRGWKVAGEPSVTTVRATWEDTNPGYWCQGPEWFAIVADGGPVERIAFGQHRDPHVEMRLPPELETATVAVDYRFGTSGSWIPLGVQRDGPYVRANLQPAYGDISLRVRVGGILRLTVPLEMEIVPAFRGEHSAAVNARVLEARADGLGAHLAWDVGAPGAMLIVERFETGAVWSEHADLLVGDDGIARYDDAAVVAGGTYGYRLAGSTAEVFVRIPAVGTALALSVAPNPTPGQVLASVTLDREAPLELTLLDLQGRVVTSRSISGLAPGLHVISLADRGRLHAGLYFVRLKRGNETLTRRVTVFE